MSYQSRVKTWIAGEVLYASDLNAEFDAILATLIPEPDSEAQGDILYRGSSTWDRLATGTKGQALTTGGASANPSWAGMTTAGDIEYFSTTRTRLAKGTSQQLLQMNSGATAPEWVTTAKCLTDHVAAADPHTVYPLDTEVLKKDGSVELTDNWEMGDYAYYSTAYFTRFESYDMWTSATTGTGSVIEALFQMQLSTGATSGSTAKQYMTTAPLYSCWQTQHYYGWRCRFESAPANETVYLLNTQDTGVATNKERAGFKIVDGRIWALSGDEVDEDTTDTGIDMTQYISKKLHVELSTANTFKFYVNDVLAATHDSITCDGYNNRFVAYIINSAAADAIFRVQQAFYFQYSL